MLRLQENGGWWLITHPEHAQLAGRFAAHWGNERFLAPEPRADVLTGIAQHDDGWLTRDAAPQITRAGLPSAFSLELVGKYSAFEEIDLDDYLTVRRRAVLGMAAQNAYAAILVSMHTYDLLSTRADRSTIAPGDLPKLDAFLAEQRALQAELRASLVAAAQYPADRLTDTAFLEHFRLLQACDNLSLLTCLDFPKPANLLHPLPTRLQRDGEPVQVERVGLRRFRLSPWPFDALELEFCAPARFVEGEKFASADELAEKLAAAPTQELPISILA